MTLSEKFQALRRQIIDEEYADLNPRQREAVYYADAPLLILAGAGSGKTTVIVNKIGYLLKYGNTYNCEEPSFEVTESDLEYLEESFRDPSIRLTNRYSFLMRESRYSPYELLAITFTNKAAAELRERIGAKFNLDTSSLWALTFHSVAMRIIRQYAHLLGFEKNFSVYDENDSIRLIDSILKRLNINQQYTGKKVKHYISQAKMSYQTPEEFADVFDDRQNSHVPLVYDMYQQGLKEANAMDFDDLIFYGVKLLEDFPEVAERINNRFKYVLVDEFQDTNDLQSRFVRLLAKGGKICVVGDDDQSIYRFMGASPDNILSFDHIYPDAVTVRLEQNYRSTENILDAANSVISHNRSRKGKTLWSENGIGEKITYHNLPSQFEEGQLIASKILEGKVRYGKKYSDYCVLYRTHAQSNNLETALRSNGIPYRVFGSLAFYKRKEIQDMLAYLNVINNPYDYTRLSRIINEPKRGIGDTTLEKVLALAVRDERKFYDVLKDAKSYPELSKAAEKLISFVALIEKYREMVPIEPLPDLFEKLYGEIGYENMLKSTYGLEDYKSKHENVMELLSNIKQFIADADDPTLGGYLEQTALVSATDTLDEGDDAAVLMTMHCAKGLEYDTVFITGFEEGLFPSMPSLGSTADIEEERRLCYVAMTRAKKKLHIISTRSRLLYGTVRPGIPSRFLEEIPHENMETVGGINRDPYPRVQPKPQPRQPRITQIPVSVMPERHSTAVKYSAGQRVRHKIFGEGVITEAVNMSSDSLLTIEFEKAGVKKLMANFAKLETID